MVISPEYGSHRGSCVGRPVDPISFRVTIFAAAAATWLRLFSLRKTGMLLLGAELEPGLPVGPTPALLLGGLISSCEISGVSSIGETSSSYAFAFLCL